MFPPDSTQPGSKVPTVLQLSAGSKLVVVNRAARCQNFLRRLTQSLSQTVLSCFRERMAYGGPSAAEPQTAIRRRT
ncbi:alphaherpesvirus glycoprotein E domain-containing protein [Anopheles sinensis]|uniref:Alphaherpesvirus glycoprotein E domain-containing protein n=1 Tax=Anopheles sinensis TaxID=74873 RepID=A0A084WMJ5_ANOSI|nr:alphaherpesvirus glycoprotein E domain-containing protein [Anopheles sinensis]